MEEGKHLVGNFETLKLLRDTLFMTKFKVNEKRLKLMVGNESNRKRIAIIRDLQELDQVI